MRIKYKPPCVRCGRRKAVRSVGNRQYQCGHCGAIFDDDPDEGGDHCTGNPAGRMEREERRRERRQDRIGRRR